ncbi:MAG: DUF5916 domain-containing protein [Gemmatimonadales bacterium]
MSNILKRCLACAALAVTLLPSAQVSAQATGLNHPVSPPVAQAVKRNGPIQIDGKLTEAAWDAATPVTKFTQSDPHESQPATQRTEVHFLYDDDALYVGARMFDSLGAKGVATRLARRDQAGDGTDLFQIIFDTFHDHQGRARFEINPSGVRNDALGSGQQNPDGSWDPIYEATATVDSLGWSAEFRIPFSQLRYPRAQSQTWGLQIRRYRAVNAELDNFSFWLKTASCAANCFGHLEGLQINAVPERVELLPYVLSRAQYIKPPSAGDPFHTGHEYDVRAGADFKYLLTSNMTLDATINPDFGQVEVDPASVNLSAFETFFPEKRPFFVANSGAFSFGNFSCFFCSNTSSLPSFYTRRIGRAPQGFANGTYVDSPENSTILGAAKITGRTGGGASIGFLDAVTRREMATAIDTAGGRREFRTEVEPLTNYSVGRLKHDYRGGNLVIGGIATSVLRSLGDSVLATRLSKHAETLGGDMSFAWKNRTYSWITSLEESHVSGSPLAMQRLQRSSARYFQRPDRKDGGNSLLSSDKFDANATSLAGYGGYSRVSKDAGDWLFEGATNFRSPGFEVNDIAFLTRADFAMFNANVLRTWTKPGRFSRDMLFIVGGQQQYNYDRDKTDEQAQVFFRQTLKNYWFYNSFYIYHPVVMDDRATRGGPVVQRPGYHFWSLFFGSDTRKPVVLQTNLDYGLTIGDHGFSYDISETVNLKPRSNVAISFGPGYSYSNGAQQYVTTINDITSTNFYGNRYVFSDLIQHTLSMDTRLDVTFSPDLTLQLYAQPFISSGAYSAFKEFDTPRRIHKTVYGEGRGTITTTGTGESRVYTIDPDGPGPSKQFTIGNPDFNFRSLRGNAVLRWEYRPGSTLFFVWNQNRADAVGVGDFDFTRDRQALFNAHPDNIFVVKMNYYLGR